ncbi:MAG: peptidyl-prolyl cis-trans isomerase [Gemmatimonadetes bacterium]|nr:peptidyl-prolyl cis-trans isomerase [Gemmatimonadota bacterium]
MDRFRGVALIIATTVTTACDALDDALNRHTDLVARAAGHELSIEQTADLLGGQTRVPNQPDVVNALANLWVDYILLATAMAEDSMAASVDLQPMVKTQVEQTLVYRLRDRVIQVDTLIPNDELRSIYAEKMPGAQIRARHILLTYPPNATEGQRDSVKTMARQLRQRAVGGAEFAELAKQYSQDPGSGPQGGDLGFFGRGQMVKPFDDVAFALKQGEISDLVESPFGIHVIKLEERRVPDFEEVETTFLEEVKTQRVLAAESTYIAGLVEPAKVTIANGAAELARQLASQPALELPRRAGRRGLVHYEGGGVTAEEFLEFIQARPPSLHSRVVAAPDQAIEGLLRELARAELLLNEARRQKIEVSAAEQDSMVAEARRFFLNAAGALGLRGIQPAQGETRSAALQRTVTELLQAMVRGERDVVPLGAVAFTLRRRYDSQFYEHNIAKVVERVQQLQAATQPAVPESVAPAPAPNAPRPIPQPAAADTTP